ncbi:MAG: hypothetical protein WCK42_00420 [Myxococcaceae bacterium]
MKLIASIFFACLMLSGAKCSENDNGDGLLQKQPETGTNPAPVEPSAQNIYETLNEVEAISRKVWALKCFPELEALLKAKEHFIDHETGEQVGGYPVFFIVNLDEKAKRLTHWLAPTDGDAPCEYPKDCMPVRYCLSGNLCT